MPDQERSRLGQIVPGNRVLCDGFVSIPDDLWAGTYCKLLYGHAGEHSAHYPAGRADAIKERHDDG